MISLGKDSRDFVSLKFFLRLHANRSVVATPVVTVKLMHDLLHCYPDIT